ncbi:MAG: CBS domain-containing protein [Gemmatimonadetes bacterium]|nr:CBS domain-containing protein [Gemmatimonadota bacterium]
MYGASTLVHHFIRDHAAEAARELENCSLDDLAPFFSQIPTELATALLNTMESSTAAACLDRLPAEVAAGGLGGLAADRAAHLVRGLTPEAGEAILEALPDEFASHMKRLLRYREDTAGALMDSLVFTVPPEVSSGEAISRLQATKARVLGYVYVVDREQTLAGVLSLAELVGADDGTSVASLMRRELMFLRTGDSVTSVLAHPSWTDYHTLPVVDDQSLFAGALRHKSLCHMAGQTERLLHPGQAGTALGELYRIGLSALASSALGAENLQPPTDDRSRSRRE